MLRSHCSRIARRLHQNRVGQGYVDTVTRSRSTRSGMRLWAGKLTSSRVTSGSPGGARTSPPPCRRSEDWPAGQLARNGGDLAAGLRPGGDALREVPGDDQLSRADLSFAGFATKTEPAGAVVRRPLLRRRTGAYGNSGSRQVQWNTTVLEPSVLVRMSGTACCRPLLEQYVSALRHAARSS
jgi:hypothetical protein